MRIKDASILLGLVALAGCCGVPCELGGNPFLPPAPWVPSGPPHDVRRADRYLASGEYVTAIWEYGKILDRREDADAALGRACALKLMCDDEGAQADLVRAARAGSVEAKALVASRLGVADAGSAAELVRRYPDRAWAWSLYGDSLLRSGQPKKAAEAYRTALNQGLKGELLPTALYNLTLAQVQSGEYDAAGRTFDSYRVARGRPLGADDHYLAGLLAYGEGAHGAALAHWRQCPAPMRARIRRTVGDEGPYAGL